jgi:predicted metal-dependent RNase
MSKETIDVARSHTSFMNFKSNLMDKMSNPFNFNYIKAITSLSEYRAAAYWSQTQRLRPLIVITSLASLNGGFSRQLLREFTSRDQNELIFIEKEGGSIPDKSIAAMILKGHKRFPFKDISIEPVNKVEKAATQDKSLLTKISKQLVDEQPKNKKDRTLADTTAKSTSLILQRRQSIEEEVKETFRNKRLEKMYRK